MAEIIPFCGIHYSVGRVPLDRVISPPYDVLSPERQEALYAQDPHNIVRLILNRSEPGDPDDTAHYHRAAAFLQQCLADGVLVQEEGPAFYEYIQRFDHPHHPGQKVERSAIFVGLRLEPYENGVVLPHEETHPKAKADRLMLMRATHANPEPIYGLYEDPQLFVAQTLQAAREGREPLLRALTLTEVTPSGEEHLIYRHLDPALHTAIEAFFKTRRVWIADGHHRYETAMNYQAELSRQTAEGEPGSLAPSPSDYLLIGLSAFEDPGLVVLPTYRLVRNIPDERLARLKERLGEYFQLQTMTVEAARAWIKVAAPDEKRFALVTSHEALALTLKSAEVMELLAESGHCPAWRALDVTILQTLVLDRALGISWKDLAHTPDVVYTREESEAVDRVASGEFQLAALLQDPTVSEVHDVAAAGDKMPQKSTFFYPKLWSGLILRTLNE